MCCHPQPLRLFRNRSSLSQLVKMQRRWNQVKTERPKPKNPLIGDQGLEVKNASSTSGRGKKMSLTSPLIDQALSHVCAFCSPSDTSLPTFFSKFFLNATGHKGDTAVGRPRNRTIQGRTAKICPLETAPLNGESGFFALPLSTWQLAHQRVRC